MYVFPITLINKGFNFRYSLVVSLNNFMILFFGFIAALLSFNHPGVSMYELLFHEGYSTIKHFHE